MKYGICLILLSTNIKELLMSKAYYVKEKELIRLTDLDKNQYNLLQDKVVYNDNLSCYELPIKYYDLLDQQIEISKSLQDYIDIANLDIPGADYWNSLIKDITLRPFQVEFLQWLEARRQLSYPPKSTQRGVCAQLTMGSGKTALGIVVDHHLRNISFIRKTLIICRSNNKYSSWVKHLEKHSKASYVVIDGERNTRLKAIEEFKINKDIAVIHFEGMRLHEVELVGIPDLVIIDEAQAISNKDSKQSQVADKITAKAKYILLLTGGIAQNKIAVQLYHGLHLLDRKMFPSFWKWRDDYCEVEEIYIPLYSKNGKKIINRETFRPVLRKAIQIKCIKDPQKLAVDIAPYMYQLTKEDIKDQLPPITFQIIETGLYPKQKELYRKIRDELTVQIKGMSIANGLTRILRLNQVCATLACLDLEDISSKADEAAEIILELPDEKALIFSQFVAMANAIYNRLIKAGAKALLLTGENPKSKEKREEIRNQFKEDPEIQYLVTTINLEGTGSDYAVASYLYRLDRVYPPLVNDQTASRVHRLTSPKPVTIIDFVTKNSVEEVQLEILEQKMNAIKDVLTPASEYTASDIAKLLTPKGY
jgi:SNF2 family DNA or RNA helicase